MKFFLPFAVSILLSHFVAAQRSEKITTYDENWKTTSEKRATYLVRVKQIEAKNFLISTYNAFGPRIKQERVTDESAKIRSGNCLYYHSNGFVDSVGTCVDNAPDGEWWYYTNKGIIDRKKQYSKGVLLTDSAMTPPSTRTVDSEPIAGEEESTFKGGLEGWMQFMNRTFNYPTRARKHGVEGTVALFFAVDEKGNPKDPEIFRSAEYSLDDEALRLMDQSPAWIPAKKDGNPVKSYKIQPVTFRLR